MEYKFLRCVIKVHHDNTTVHTNDHLNVFCPLETLIYNKHIYRLN